MEVQTMYCAGAYVGRKAACALKPGATACPSGAAGLKPQLYKTNSSYNPGMVSRTSLSLLLYLDLLARLPMMLICRWQRGRPLRSRSISTSTGLCPRRFRCSATSRAGKAESTHAPAASRREGMQSSCWAGEPKGASVSQTFFELKIGVLPDCGGWC
jgi:hypothetical protein